MAHAWQAVLCGLQALTSRRANVHSVPQDMLGAGSSMLPWRVSYSTVFSTADRGMAAAPCASGCRMQHLPDGAACCSLLCWGDDAVERLGLM